MSVPDSPHAPIHTSQTAGTVGGAPIASDPAYGIGVLLADSITALPDEPQGRFIVCGSHGGIYPALVAAHEGVAGVIFNDAGVGLCRAGIAGIDVLDYLGIPAACVSNFSARIGDARDILDRGFISFCNRHAATIGWTPGTDVKSALEAMTQSQPSDSKYIPHPSNYRFEIERYSMKVVIIDSASLVTSEDADSIIVTGSHGGRVRSRTGPLRYPVRGAVFNDAGFGADLAGIARLRLLDEGRIPAAVVANHSARIGDGLSTLQQGVVSAMNSSAVRVGARTGMSTNMFVDLVSRAPRA